ncbi:MAG TPA: DUF1801 domain-containing protein [Microlunatus sp.]|nr:DUF1801 domain-containing protein [Microlunatus sp.]
MATAKTVPTEASVPDFLAGIADARRRADAQVVCDLMAEVTGEEPVLWGTSIVGFGEQTLTIASGKPSAWMEVGFAPRKAATVIYLMDGFEHRADLLDRLGPHSIGKACLYLKRLDDVDLAVLRALLSASVAESRRD